MTHLTACARKTRDAATPGTVVHDHRCEWRIEKWICSRYAAAVAVKDSNRRTLFKLGEFDIGPLA